MKTLWFQVRKKLARIIGMEAGECEPLPVPSKVDISPNMPPRRPIRASVSSGPLQSIPEGEPLSIASSSRSGSRVLARKRSTLHSVEETQQPTMAAAEIVVGESLGNIEVEETDSKRDPVATSVRPETEHDALPTSSEEDVESMESGSTSGSGTFTTGVQKKFVSMPIGPIGPSEPYYPSFKDRPTGMKGHGEVVYGDKQQMMKVVTVWVNYKEQYLIEAKLAKHYREEGVILSEFKSKLKIKGLRYQRDFQWIKVAHLGNGMTGKCLLATDFETEFKFCVKELHIANYEKEEIMLWSELEHRNIVQVYGAIRHGEKIYILQEFIEGGCLTEAINVQRKLGRRLGQLTALKYFKELLQVLKYLKSKNILHEDLKADNILLNITPNGVSIKVTDFGLARRCPGTVRHGTAPVGTQTQWSPEKAKAEGYSYPAEIWAAVCVLVHMLSGFPPWVKRFETFKALIVVIVEKSPPTEDVPCNIQQPIRELIEWGFTVNPAQRPTTEQLLTHHAFKLLEQAQSNPVYSILESAHLESTNHISDDPNADLREIYRNLERAGKGEVGAMSSLDASRVVQKASLDFHQQNNDFHVYTALQGAGDKAPDHGQSLKISANETVVGDENTSQHKARDMQILQQQISRQSRPRIPSQPDQNLDPSQHYEQFINDDAGLMIPPHNQLNLMPYLPSVGSEKHSSEHSSSIGSLVTKKLIPDFGQLGVLSSTVGSGSNFPADVTYYSHDPDDKDNLDSKEPKDGVNLEEAMEHFGKNYLPTVINSTSPGVNVSPVGEQTSVSTNTVGQNFVGTKSVGQSPASFNTVGQNFVGTKSVGPSPADKAQRNTNIEIVEPTVNKPVHSVGELPAYNTQLGSLIPNNKMSEKPIISSQPGISVSQPVGVGKSSISPVGQSSPSTTERRKENQYHIPTLDKSLLPANDDDVLTSFQDDELFKSGSPPDKGFMLIPETHSLLPQDVSPGQQLLQSSLGPYNVDPYPPFPLSNYANTAVTAAFQSPSQQLQLGQREVSGTTHGQVRMYNSNVAMEQRHSNKMEIEGRSMPPPSRTSPVYSSSRPQPGAAEHKFTDYSFQYLHHNMGMCYDPNRQEKPLDLHQVKYPVQSAVSPQDTYHQQQQLRPALSSPVGNIVQGQEAMLIAQGQQGKDNYIKGKANVSAGQRYIAEGQGYISEHGYRAPDQVFTSGRQDNSTQGSRNHRQVHIFSQQTLPTVHCSQGQRHGEAYNQRNVFISPQQGLASMPTRGHSQGNKQFMYYNQEFESVPNQGEIGMAQRPGELPGLGYQHLPTQQGLASMPNPHMYPMRLSTSEPVSLTNMGYEANDQGMMNMSQHHVQHNGAKPKVNPSQKANSTLKYGPQNPFPNDRGNGLTTRAITDPRQTFLPNSGLKFPPGKPAYPPQPKTPILNPAINPRPPVPQDGQKMDLRLDINKAQQVSAGTPVSFVQTAPVVSPPKTPKKSPDLQRAMSQVPPSVRKSPSLTSNVFSPPSTKEDRMSTSTSKSQFEEQDEAFRELERTAEEDLSQHSDPEHRVFIDIMDDEHEGKGELDEINTEDPAQSLAHMIDSSPDGSILLTFRSAVNQQEFRMRLKATYANKTWEKIIVEDLEGLARLRVLEEFGLSRICLRRENGQTIDLDSYLGSTPQQLMIMVEAVDSDPWWIEEGMISK